MADALQGIKQEMHDVIATGLGLDCAPDTDDVTGDPTGDEQAGTEKHRAAVLKSLAGSDPVTGDVEYAIVKSSAEDRFTLGPLYAPLRQDAHGEWTDADVLQKAVWSFMGGMVSKKNNRLNLQHGDFGNITVGHVVELVSWPYEHEITVTKSGSTPRQLTMPAGTVYMGVVWDSDAWPLVKSGRINGYSLGGRAVRAAGGDATMLHMGDRVLPKQRANLATRTRDRMAKSLEPLLAKANATPVERSAIEQGATTPGDEHPANAKPKQPRHPVTGKYQRKFKPGSTSSSPGSLDKSKFQFFR